MQFVFCKKLLEDLHFLKTPMVIFLKNAPKDFFFLPHCQDLSSLCYQWGPLPPSSQNTSAARGRLHGIQIWLFSLGREGKDPVSLMFITVGQGLAGEG